MIGIHHDGTTQLGGAFSILIRFLDAMIRVQARVVEIKWYEFSLNNENLNAAIISAVCPF